MIFGDFKVVKVAKVVVRPHLSYGLSVRNSTLMGQRINIPYLLGLNLRARYEWKIKFFTKETNC